MQTNSPIPASTTRQCRDVRFVGGALEKQRDERGRNNATGRGDYFSHDDIGLAVRHFSMSLNTDRDSTRVQCLISLISNFLSFFQGDIANIANIADIAVDITDVCTVAIRTKNFSRLERSRQDTFPNALQLQYNGLRST